LKCECEADWLLLLEEKEEISEIRSKWMEDALVAITVDLISFLGSNGGRMP